MLAKWQKNERDRRQSVNRIEMSDSEYEYSGSESGSGSDSGSEDSYTSIRMALEEIREKMEAFDSGVESLHTHVKTMEQPVTSVAVASFAQPAYLESAPFRKELFRMKEQARAVFSLGTVESYSSLCKKIRKYLFEHKLVDSSGAVRLTKEMKDVFETEDETMSFLAILSKLDHFVE